MWLMGGNTGQKSLPVSFVSKHYTHSCQRDNSHPAGFTMILCCMCSTWLACILFHDFVLWLLWSFVWSFVFHAHLFFSSFFFVCFLSLVGCTSCVCLCCHFLSSAGVWATESKGDHSGSARQLDSGSRCGVLLSFSPPEPSFVSAFWLFFSLREFL